MPMSPRVAAPLLDLKVIIAILKVTKHLHTVHNISLLFELTTGDKKILAWFRNYLVLVLRDGKVSRETGTVSKSNTVTIYDVRNKVCDYLFFKKILIINLFSFCFLNV